LPRTIFLATFFTVNAGKQIPNKVLVPPPKKTGIPALFGGPNDKKPRVIIGGPEKMCEQISPPNPPS
jgi:hypothetical protein